MSTTTRHIGKQSRKVTKDLQEMGAVARDAAQEKVGQLRENAAGYYEQSRDSVYQAERGVEQFIRDRPVKSVLVAAGIGVLLGGFWMRR